MSGKADEMTAGQVLTRLENMVEAFTVRRMRGNTRDMVSPKSMHQEAVEAINALIIEALEDVECCKHGYGDACPHIRQSIAELNQGKE